MINNQLHERRVQALRKAFDAGLSLRAAASHCGISKATVERYWRRWKSDDFGGELVARVKGETKRAFRAEAERREISIHELVACLLETIAEDNMFDAIMDN